MAPPTGTIPPELPPSVEEAYRAKCIQLKQRLNEIEEANDGARARISRINRGIQKSRLERAFLLEQLAKRTSTHVEDSEGSPSPPPTPKEKPLRTKRGHRKPEFMNPEVSESRSANIVSTQGPATVSPSSDAFSHTHPESLQNATPQAHSQLSKRQLSNNDTSTPTISRKRERASSQNKSIKGAFEIYCNETRSFFASENRKEISDGSFNLEAALVRSWGNLETSQKNEYRLKYEKAKNSVDKTRTVHEKGTLKQEGDSHLVEEGDDDDTEMPDNVNTPVVIPEISGFTPVNRV
ncbi:putative hmg box protein [Erysiphe necator]|uniref:Putative hmg box protein n=1 Tax=Uncinula necator TaxID=52586 RepID=A0A0B1PGH6_UNCNE|nr:putative hmg box protein [Erysiphe necator]